LGDKLEYFKKYPGIITLEGIERYAEDNEIELLDEQKFAICEELVEDTGWIIQEAFEKILQRKSPLTLE
jgi:hypothetical protein